MRFCLIGKNPDYVLAYRGSLIRAALARGHEVHAITADTSRRAAARLADAGVSLHMIPLHGATSNPISDLRTMRAMTRTLRAVRPDAVFCYNPKPVAYGPRAARRAGVRRVAAMVTGLGYSFTGSGVKRALVRSVATRLYRRSLRACDAVFFQNKDDLATATRRGIVAATPAMQGRPTKSPRVIMVAGSGVDLDRFASAPLPPPPTVRFLMIARIIRDKGAVEFVDACRLVKQRVPHATFAILGGQDDNPTAVPQRDIERWKREGVVELVGEVDDVRPELARCTVFVLPSHREGTSKVMLEAMSVGRAIITTDTIGCREPVSRGVNGLLVPVQDADALAKAMIELAQDRPRVESMAAESRRIAEQRYDARKVDAAILDALGL
ncbi:MAG: glycosyltransferase family 4 protein [Phycisphaerae bacterium]|nr:glycosyltransferase family 4 protein [Phycisphaerae bacterium]